MLRPSCAQPSSSPYHENGKEYLVAEPGPNWNRRTYAPSSVTTRHEPDVPSGIDQPRTTLADTTLRCYKPATGNAGRGMDAEGKLRRPRCVC